jgi:hypothetical protein
MSKSEGNENVNVNDNENYNGNENVNAFIAPELNFNFMIDGKEILSVEEAFKEKFPVLLTDLKILHGELKIKKWIADFSTLHKQKSWKDYQDFRHHISSYIKQSSERKEYGSNKKPIAEKSTTAGKF